MTPVKIIDADAHMCEPPNLWVERIDQRFRERADKYYRRWKGAYNAPLSLKPSEYFRRQCYATFIDDPLGLEIYQRVGVDNMMWSTDYPHQAATWPHSQEVLARDFRGVPEADLRKIVRENTARLYGFAPA